MLFAGILVLASFSGNAQTAYTPYDELPAINKLEKPAYDENYPEWAKKLYRYPVNFNEICKEFDDYIATSGTVKNEIIRYFKNWRSAVAPYAKADGTIVLPDMKRLSKKNREALMQRSSKLKSTQDNNSDWTFLGPKETIWRATASDPTKTNTPTPWQANVYSFDVAKTDNNILFCGTETGFVNKSTDNGLTWQVCGLNYPFSGGIRAIAIDPADANTVYVAAGDQVHKTTDGGVTWMPMLKNKFGASRLRIDANNNRKIVAACDNGINISTDGGVTWTNGWNKATWDIEIKPDDSNIIYGISAARNNKFELVISKDGGNTFNPDPNFPSGLTNTSGGLLAVTPANPNIVYVSLLVAENNDKYAYVYKGNYNGTSWSWTLKIKGPPRSEAGLGGFSTGQGYFDFVLDAAPEDENTVFWGTCSLFKSTNGGSNFEKIGGYGGSFNIHPDIQDIKLLGNGKMWVSTDGGMSYSTDYFVSANNFHPRIKGLIGSHLWGFDMGWNQDIIVGGRYHNGNMALNETYGDRSLRMGGAEAPTGWIIQGKENQAAFSDINKGYTTTIPATTEEVVADKKYFFSKLPNMKQYGHNRGNLLFHPNYHSIVYVGEGTGFWKSTDMGETFDLLQDFPGDVMFMQISHKNPDVIYIDVAGKGLYKTEDGGTTWTFKNSLTDTYGDPGWAGKLHFVISPYDENRIYICPQKDARLFTGETKILRSDDGGDTWTDWFGSLTQNDYTKSLVIQPTTDGKDLVYIFTTSKKGDASVTGKVYYRKEGMNDWVEYDNNYPVDLRVNLALPFYRDSKLRVAGNAGIWESPFAEPDYTPVINPWIDKPVSRCISDTLQLDDHSMLNHEGVTWKWTITPEPSYVSDHNIRNPKIVPGIIDTFTVTLEVTKNGTVYSKTIPNMFRTTSCPSVGDCSNPAGLDKSEWKLIYSDSEESNRAATNTFDDDNSTFWHTEWRYNQPGHPHEIQIDLGRKYYMHRFSIVNRPTGTNGRTKNYRLYLSNSKTKWGQPVSEGAFENVLMPQPVKFSAPPTGRYLRFVSLSEVNGNYFTSVAEINITGCYNNGNGILSHRITKEISAFPVPTSGVVNLTVPPHKNLKYGIYSAAGQKIIAGEIRNSGSHYSFNLSGFSSGIYFVIMTDEAGVTYRAKIVKE